jgi:hypothetical protein
LIDWQAKTNFFEAKSKWSYFSENFSQKFQTRLKKDLVVIAWASGVLRKDLFLEYFCLMLKVIETESRFHRYRNEFKQVEGKVVLSKDEHENTIPIIEGKIKSGEGFKMVDAHWMRKLMDLRKDFLNEVVPEKMKVPKRRRNQASTQTQTESQ